MAAVAAAGHGHAATASTAPPAGLKSTSQLEDVERKYHTLVRKAKAVFTAIPAAEELEATWTGLKLGDLPEPVEACLRAKSCSTEPTLELSIANEGQDQGKLLMIPLKVLKKGLDAGRSVTAPPGRGLPLWLAVRRAFCASNADRSAAEHRHVLQIRALKASWHQEGTYEETTKASPQTARKRALRSPSLPSTQTQTRAKPLQMMAATQKAMQSVRR
jgi:hypothetical protein